MPSFIALFPAILILSLILYAVVDSDRVDQAQQRALGRGVRPKRIGQAAPP